MRKGQEEKDLQAALGKPRYYLDAEDKKDGEQYFWFPTLGDSMTDRSAGSIPAGSLVLGRLLDLQSVQDIPLHQPIVLIINDNGQQFCILKCAREVQDDQFRLHSYNSRYEDFWLPFSCVKFIFLVERVRLPDGNEFVPVTG